MREILWFIQFLFRRKTVTAMDALYPLKHHCTGSTCKKWSPLYFMKTKGPYQGHINRVKRNNALRTNSLILRFIQFARTRSIFNIKFCKRITFIYMFPFRWQMAPLFLNGFNSFEVNYLRFQITLELKIFDFRIVIALFFIIYTEEEN